MSGQVEAEIRSPVGDRRVERTRSALRAAFNGLILSSGYDGFSAANVAEQAGVGRSTFYEHYQGKADLLARTLVPVLAPLAECAFGSNTDERLAQTVRHFWDNRRLARAMMAGRAHAVMISALSQLIEQRVWDRCPDEGSSACGVPPALIAIQIAAGQLAMIGEWLSGRHGSSAEAVAKALFASSRAIVDGYTKTTPAAGSHP